MKQEVIQKAEEKPKQRGPNLTGIPTQMKLDFEQCSGLSFDDVRVHYNSDKPRKIGALAYTQIPQVHIGPGNESKLSHELGHVIQQKMEPIAPTITLNGFQINASPYMESDADSPFTMRENLQFSSSPLQTKSTVIQCSFVEGESLRDILKNQYELQIKLLPLKNADESLFVQPGEPNYSVDKLATYSDSLVHESSGNSQETAAHEIPTNVNSTTVPTEFAGIDNLKIFFNGKIAPFTTVGFEHEFARWPKQNKNSFSGIIHVKLGYSKTEWSYTGERFSLETDSGDKLELVSPPLLVETDFSAIPKAGKIEHINGAFEDFLNAIMRDNKSLCDLMENIKSESGGIIDFALIENIGVTPDNFTSESKLRKNAKKAFSKEYIKGLLLTKNEVINTQLNIATDPAPFLRIKDASSLSLYNKLTNALFEVLSPVCGDNTLCDLLIRLFIQIPASIIMERAYHLKESQMKLLMGPKKGIFSKKKLSKKESQELINYQTLLSCVKDAGRVWLKANPYDLLKSMSDLLVPVDIQSLQSDIVSIILKKTASHATDFQMDSKVFSKEIIKKCVYQIIHDIEAIKQERFAEQEFKPIRSDTYLNDAIKNTPSFRNKKLYIVELRPSGSSTQANSERLGSMIEYARKLVPEHQD